MKILFLIIPVLFCSTTPPNRKLTLVSCENKSVSIFLNSIWSDAERISQTYSIPIELILAQACQETGFGKSNKCRNDCNFFGVKGGVYANMSESFLHYARVLSAPCYKNLQPKTLDQWLLALECCHYAADKRYTKILKLIIKKYMK